MCICYLVVLQCVAFGGLPTIYVFLTGGESAQGALQKGVAKLTGAIDKCMH